MYLTTLPIEQAIGHILRHNLSDADGHKTLAKGRRLRDADLPRLRELGLEQVRVAVLEPGDLHEDEAARRLGAAIVGTGVVATSAVHSRVNLLAATDGVVEVDVAALHAINRIDGLTVATLRCHSPATARQRIATIKIIPFAVPEADLEQAEAIAHAASAIIQVRPLQRLAVGVVLIGGSAARERILNGVYPAIEARVVEYGSTVLVPRYVAPDEAQIAEALLGLCADGAGLLICAGETSIMDRDDVTPQAIRLAGGRIEQYGAAVEPGNLLLLAYFDAQPPVPILGAPGCVRSRSTNIVDLLLPRLLSGEIVTREAIIDLGHGGLLNDT